jgi:UDP-glucose 4-epimerase
MRLVVTGATGNVGTALLRLLRTAPEVSQVRAVVRRPPEEDEAPYDQAEWAAVDLASGDSVARLTRLMRRADAVAHLAWDIVGGRGRREQRRTNLLGTGHVLAAMAAARVPHLIHLSSVAAYAPEPGHRLRVTEEWPLGGIPGSSYSADKVAAERLLDRASSARPDLTVARLRPPAVLQPEAGSELGRYLLGRLSPVLRYRWLRPQLLPLPDFSAQVVHAADVADLIWRVLRVRSAGAYNVASEPVLRSSEIATALGARRMPAPVWLLAPVLDASSTLRVQPLDRSWLDMITQAPLVSSRRAREELGWQPTHQAYRVVAAVGRAVYAGAGAASPRLAPR